VPDDLGSYPRDLGTAPCARLLQLLQFSRFTRVGTMLNPVHAQKTRECGSLPSGLFRSTPSVRSIHTRRDGRSFFLCARKWPHNLLLTSFLVHQSGPGV